MLYYVPATVDKSTCIGNSLSTINIGFSSLDNNLQGLSAWTVSSINFLSATMISVSSTLQNEIQFLSSTMISVSSTLQTEINYLSSNIVSVSANLQGQINTINTEINYLSANIVNSPYTIYHEPSGGITWDIARTGRNANLTLSSNCYMRNPLNMVAGQQGNISIISSGTSAYSITAFGNNWLFANNASAMKAVPNARNLIKYYYDGAAVLSQMIQF